MLNYARLRKTACNYICSYFPHHLGNLFLCYFAFVGLAVTLEKTDGKESSSY